MFTAVVLTISQGSEAIRGKLKRGKWTIRHTPSGYYADESVLEKFDSEEAVAARLVELANLQEAALAQL